MAAPFEQAFAEYEHLRQEASKYTTEEAPQGVREGGEVRAIHYREEEAIYVKASHDRVTVIFSTTFKDETDKVFGKVFIQEFVDARRRAIQNAPQVLYRNDAPLELQGVPGVRQGSSNGELGYVTFGMVSGLWALMALAHADCCSPVPPASDAATHDDRHRAHPDVPRLFPLPHQSIQGGSRQGIHGVTIWPLTAIAGLHPLANAPANQRLPPRCVARHRLHHS
jgi:hypothetical protein